MVLSTPVRSYREGSKHHIFATRTSLSAGFEKLKSTCGAPVSNRAEQRSTRHLRVCMNDALFPGDLAVGHESLRDDLVHVVATVGCEASDEVHLGLSIGEFFVPCVNNGIFLALDGTIRIALGDRVPYTLRSYPRMSVRLIT
jgi:hypothetical protein